MLNSRILTIEEAAAGIPDGSVVTVGGFGVFLQPMAMMREMIRQGKKDINLLSVGEAYAADLLVGGGCVRSVTLASFGFEAVTGRSRNFCKAVEQGKVEVEDYSHFSMASRFLAGAMGLPFTAVHSMRGSDLLDHLPEGKKYVKMDCPFSGEEVILLPAAKPDIAVIQAQRADMDGNLQVMGPTICIEEQARAAKRVIAIVEEIVPRSVIQANPTATLLPSFFVDTLVVLPYSAHPMASYGYYDYDLEHLYTYTNSSKTPESWKGYLDEYVYAPKDHYEYLEQVGGLRKIMQLRADPLLGY